MFHTTALLLGLVAPAPNAAQNFLYGSFPMLAMMLGLAAMYFMIILPQQRRAKEHASRISGIKRGDTVVLSSGMIGKVVRVEDSELGIEVAQNVTVKVVKAMVQDVRTRGEPVAANDAKS